MAQEGVYVFPDVASHTASSSIDPGLLALLNQNGGFGGNGNWIWILYMIEDKGEPPAYTIGYLLQRMWKVSKDII